MLVDLTQEYLRSIMSYDPETGNFTTKVRSGKRRAGQPAELVLSSGVNGYSRKKIVINARHYMAHRLAWLYVFGVWPEKDLDHIDGDPMNNRIANLRLATNSQNLGNMRKPITNTSGKKGVSWHAKAGKWQSHVRIERKNTYLGLFDTVDAAHADYCEAATKGRGEFARFE